MPFRIIKRKRWSVFPYSGTPMGQVRDVFIHHDAAVFPETASREVERVRLRNNEAYHVNVKKYAAIAYSFLISPKGRVYEGRGWDKAGAHTYDHNSTSYGICFLGNFEAQKPTRRALRRARALIRRGVRKGFIAKNHTIRGHRDVGAQGGSTACPGKHLYAQLDFIRG